MGGAGASSASGGYITPVKPAPVDPAALAKQTFTPVQAPKTAPAQKAPVPVTYANRSPANPAQGSPEAGVVNAINSARADAAQRGYDFNPSYVAQVAPQAVAQLPFRAARFTLQTDGNQNFVLDTATGARTRLPMGDTRANQAVVQRAVALSRATGRLVTPGTVFALARQAGAQERGASYGSLGNTSLGKEVELSSRPQSEGLFSIGPQPTQGGNYSRLSFSPSLVNNETVYRVQGTPAPIPLAETPEAIMEKYAQEQKAADTTQRAPQNALDLAGAPNASGVNLALEVEARKGDMESIRAQGAEPVVVNSTTRQRLQQIGLGTYQIGQVIGLPKDSVQLKFIRTGELPAGGVMTTKGEVGTVVYSTTKQSGVPKVFGIALPFSDPASNPYTAKASQNQAKASERLAQALGGGQTAKDASDLITGGISFVTEVPVAMALDLAQPGVAYASRGFTKLQEGDISGLSDITEALTGRATIREKPAETIFTAATLFLPKGIDKVAGRVVASGPIGETLLKYGTKLAVPLGTLATGATNAAIASASGAKPEAVRSAFFAGAGGFLTASFVLPKLVETAGKQSRFIRVSEVSQATLMDQPGLKALNPTEAAQRQALRLPTSEGIVQSEARATNLFGGRASGKGGFETTTTSGLEGGKSAFVAMEGGTRLSNGEYIPQTATVRIRQISPTEYQGTLFSRSVFRGQGIEGGQVFVSRVAQIGVRDEVLGLAKLNLPKAKPQTVADFPIRVIIAEEKGRPVMSAESAQLAIKRANESLIKAGARLKVVDISTENFDYFSQPKIGGKAKYPTRMAELSNAGEPTTLFLTKDKLTAEKAFGMTINGETPGPNGQVVVDTQFNLKTISDTIAHEFGHVFELGHTNKVTEFFKPDSIMKTGSSQFETSTKSFGPIESKKIRETLAPYLEEQNKARLDRFEQPARTEKMETSTFFSESRGGTTAGQRFKVSSTGTVTQPTSATLEELLARLNSETSTPSSGKSNAGGSTQTLESGGPGGVTFQQIQTLKQFKPFNYPSVKMPTPASEAVATQALLQQRATAGQISLSFQRSAGLALTRPSSASRAKTTTRVEERQANAPSVRLNQRELSNLRLVQVPRQVQQPRTVQQPRSTQMPRLDQMPRTVVSPRLAVMPRTTNMPRQVQTPRTIVSPRTTTRPASQTVTRTTTYSSEIFQPGPIPPIPEPPWAPLGFDMPQGPQLRRADRSERNAPKFSYGESLEAIGLNIRAKRAPRETFGIGTRPIVDAPKPKVKTPPRVNTNELRNALAYPKRSKRK